MPTALSQITACFPTDSCLAHRRCEFATDFAYDYVENVLFTAAGCAPSCKNQCECTCNMSGPVYEALREGVPDCTNPICASRPIQRAMNYVSPGWKCETVWTIALGSVYELCSTSNGVCNHGTCTSFYCSDSIEAACEQTVGPSVDVQWFMALYIIVAVTLYSSAAYIPRGTAPPSYNYILVCFLVVAFAAVWVNVATQFSVSVTDPILDDTAVKPYTVHCYAFSAKVTGRSGDTHCPSYAFGNPCWQVIQSVNTGTCGGEAEFIAVGEEFYTYGTTTGAMVLAMFLTAAGALGLTAAIYRYPHRLPGLVPGIAFLHAGMAAMAVATLNSAANSIDQASYNDNSNRGQTAHVGAGLIVVIALPIILLLLDISIVMWGSAGDDAGPSPVKKKADPQPTAPPDDAPPRYTESASRIANLKSFM